MEENVFGKEKQSKLKLLSKIIYILAKIAKIFTIIGVVCVILGTVLGFAVASKIELSVKNNKEVNIKLFDGNFTMKRDDGKLAISTGDSWTKVGEINETEFNKIVEAAKNFSMDKSMISIGVSVVFFIASMIVYVFIIGKTEKLFKNINQGTTPFTLDNVKIMKTIVFLMIAAGVLSIIGTAIINLVFKVQFNAGFELMKMLVIYCMAYIFEYGYKLQKNSEEKIYDEN